jgi:hypothetical protein
MSPTLLRVWLTLNVMSERISEMMLKWTLDVEIKRRGFLKFIFHKFGFNMHHKNYVLIHNSQLKQQFILSKLIVLSKLVTLFHKKGWIILFLGLTKDSNWAWWMSWDKEVKRLRLKFIHERKSKISAFIGIPVKRWSRVVMTQEQLIWMHKRLAW